MLTSLTQDCEAILSYRSVSEPADNTLHDYSGTSKIFFPYHDLGLQHWLLVVFDLNQKTIYTCNSLVSRPCNERAARVATDLLDKLRIRQGATWQVEELACAKQVGIIDCGIFTIVHAVYLMLNRPLPSKLDVSLWRAHLATLLQIPESTAKYGQGSKRNPTGPKKPEATLDTNLLRAADAKLKQLKSDHEKAARFDESLQHQGSIFAALLDIGTASQDWRKDIGQKQEVAAQTYAQLVHQAIPHHNANDEIILLLKKELKQRQKLARSTQQRNETCSLVIVQLTLLTRQTISQMEESSATMARLAERVSTMEKQYKQACDLLRCAIAERD